jgi:hypothetical protein
MRLVMVGIGYVIQEFRMNLFTLQTVDFHSVAHFSNQRYGHGVLRFGGEARQHHH